VTIQFWKISKCPKNKLTSAKGQILEKRPPRERLVEICSEMAVASKKAILALWTKYENLGIQYESRNNPETA
jgi:arsenate reductase-like glutaredoxin family protein